MAVTKAKKTEQVEKLSKDLSNVSHMVVATYTKMTVSQDFELRKALRERARSTRLSRTRWPNAQPRAPRWKAR